MLTRELEDYWRILEPALAWDTEQRSSRSYAFLRDEVLPRRMAMVGIADQIARLNERQLNDDNLQVESLFSQFRFRLVGTVIVTLGLGLLLAALSMSRILRLERESKPLPGTKRPGGAEGPFGPAGAGAGERADRHLARAAR